MRPRDLGINRNMKPKAARPGSVIQSSHALVAIACAALLSSGNTSLQAQTAPPPTQPAVRIVPRPRLRRRRQRFRMISWIRWWRRSRCIPIRCWRKRWPPPLIRSKSSSFSSGCKITRTSRTRRWPTPWQNRPWDPSVQSMAGVPEARERLAVNIQWTTDLGNAFLAQQQDVFDAIQRMRAKAQGNGALKTSQEQTVETQTVEGGKEVIVIQQPNPEVVYVPSYDPTVVYGAPAYPYYPYTYPGYIPGAGLVLGAGIIAGGIWANNNWGNCNWGTVATSTSTTTTILTGTTLTTSTAPATTGRTIPRIAARLPIRIGRPRTVTAALIAEGRIPIERQAIEPRPIEPERRSIRRNKPGGDRSAAQQARRRSRPRQQARR